MRIENVHHTVYSMFLAIRRRLAALEVEVRLPCARVTRAAPAANVYHVALSMLATVHRDVAAFKIIPRPLRAGVM